MRADVALERTELQVDYFQVLDEIALLFER